MKTKVDILQLQLPGAETGLIRDILIKAGLCIDLSSVHTKEALMQALNERVFDVILYHGELPSLTAAEALALLHNRNITVPFILISLPGQDEFAAAMLKKGAADYIEEDQLHKLPIVISNAVEKYRLQKELALCRQESATNAEKYHVLTSQSAEGVLVLSAEGKPLEVSSNVEKILGYSREEILKINLPDIAHPDDMGALAEVLMKVLASPGVPITGHTGRMLHKDKSWRWIEATVTNMLHDPAINGIVDNFRDVTDQKNADEKIIQLNRLYAFISQINQAISHSKNQTELFKKVCGIAINTGKFKAAWIGFYDLEKKKIDQVEAIGIMPQDLPKFNRIFYTETGPLKLVLQTKSHYVCNDIRQDFPFQDWKDLAAKRGYGSVIILPVLKSGAVVASFALCAAEINFFTTPEIKLLVEATADLSFSLDLFERQQQKSVADELITHKELLLNQAQSTAHLGSWELDFATGIAEWSDEMLRIYGLPVTAHRQTRASWISYIHPDDLERVLTLTKEAHEAGTNVDFYHRILRKDGTVRHLHSLTNLESDSNGKAIGIHGVGYDVTEIKQAEEALRKSEADLQAIFENTSEGFILTDKKGIIKSLNNKCREIARLTTGKEIEAGQSIFDLIMPSRSEGYEANVAKVMAGGSVEYDHAFERNDGEVYWYNFKFNPVYSRGVVEGVSITTADITPRKLAEELSRRSASNLKAIIENTDAIIYSLDRDLKYITYNSALENMMQQYYGIAVYPGYPVFDFIDIFDAGNKDEWTAIYAKAFNGEIVKFEKEYRLNDSTGHTSFSIHPIWENNVVIGISCFVNDITKQKQDADALKNSEFQYRQIVETAQEGIWMTDEEDQTTFVNKKMCEILGYAAGEMTGKPKSFFKDQKGLEIAKNNLQKRRQGITETYDASFVTKEGKLIWTRIASNPIITDDGVYKGSLYMVADITGKKRLEKAVKSERDQFFEIFLKAPSAIGMLKGADHIFEMVNPLYLQLIGKKDVLGKTVAEILPEVIDQGFIELLDHVFMTGESYIGNEVLVKIDKEGNGILADTYLNLVYQAYKDSEGNIAGVFFFLNDITEQQKAKENLLVTSERLLLAKTSADMGIWDWDLVNDTLTWDDRMFELYGIAKQNFAGNVSVWKNALHPDDLEEATKKVNDAIAGVSDFNAEFRIVWPDKTVHFIEAHGIISKNGDAVAARMIGVNLDITQRKIAEEKVIDLNDAVAKSEKFFKGVIENSDDMITMVDHTGKTIYASPAVSRKFGYTPAECLNLNMTDIVHPDDIPVVQEFMMKVLKNPGVPIECPLIRDMIKDGSYIWVEGTLTNFLETKGINAVVANFRDVTQNKKLETLLNKSNRLARIGSWEIDVANNGLFWSDITKEIREVPPDFVPELTDGISYFKEGKDKETVTHRVQNCIDNGVPWDEELEITTHKGNSKWVRTIGEGEFADGRCLRVYGSFQDITARKTAELEALKANAEKNTILESIGDGFFAVDKNWVVTYWNSQAEKMLGVAKTEIVGYPFWQIFRHGAAPHFYKKHYKAIENKEVSHFEEYYAPLKKWYGVSAYPSNTGLSVYFKDITENKIAEQKLKALNHDLEKSVKQLVVSNEELEQFAYVASHDLQEPLRMVTSFLSQIEKKYATLLDDKGKKYIHFAMDGAKRMRQIILDLLEFSVVGQVDDKLELVNTNDLIDEILSLLRRRIEEKKATINISALPVIKTLKSPLRQVFQNLISNSLKYHHNDILPSINIGVLEQDQYWQFYVRDNGIGIEPEYFDKIFTIFQRLHNKDEYSGTGIGLAISKKIVERMGGRIWVASEDGNGSTFYFTLPKLS